MKKILIINTNFKHGGAAIVAKRLFYKIQPIFGFDEVTFAYGRGGKSKEKNTFYFGNKIETLLHIFLVRFLGLEGCGTFFSTYKLIKFIKKDKFNIIHLHNLHGYYLNFFWLLKWLNKNDIKIVWSLHDEWVLTWLPAHSLDCKHCLGGGGRCVNNYDYPKNYFPIFKKLMIIKKQQIFTYKNITFVSPASWLFDKVKQLYPNVLIKNINNSIDVDLFKPRVKKDLRVQYGLPLDKKIILLSATNFDDKNKGGEFISDLLNHSQMKNTLFISFGRGRMPIVDNLINFGHLTDLKKIADLYALSDIFYFPSFAETASLSILEALASGLPIVVLDIPANNFIKVNSCGFVFRKNELSELPVKILHLLDDTVILENMSRSGRELALKNFDENLTSIEYINLYNSL